MRMPNLQFVESATLKGNIDVEPTEGKMFSWGLALDLDLDLTTAPQRQGKRQRALLNNLGDGKLVTKMESKLRERSVSAKGD